MYIDKSLTNQVVLAGNQKANDGALYIGGHSIIYAVAGAGYDNFQIFNKALTRDEIAILSLANKNVVQDYNKPRSIILFNENLVLAYDFE